MAGHCWAQPICQCVPPAGLSRLLQPHTHSQATSVQALHRLPPSCLTHLPPPPAVTPYFTSLTQRRHCHVPASRAKFVNSYELRKLPVTSRARAGSCVMPLQYGLRSLRRPAHARARLDERTSMCSGPMNNCATVDGLLCLWYCVGEGGLDLAEGTDRNPGVSYYSGILLCAVTTQRSSRSGAD
eukprot:COSAG02_NODE_3938_length_6013_cov_109.379270_3_plen_184_part_00